MSTNQNGKRLLIALAMEAGKGPGTKTSSLTKFVCGCTSIYTERSDFRARCLTCGQHFVLDNGPEPGACGAVVPPTLPVLPARCEAVAEAA